MGGSSESDIRIDRVTVSAFRELFDGGDVAFEAQTYGPGLGGSSESSREEVESSGSKADPESSMSSASRLECGEFEEMFGHDLTSSPTDADTGVSTSRARETDESDMHVTRDDSADAESGEGGHSMARSPDTKESSSSDEPESERRFDLARGTDDESGVPRIDAPDTHGTSTRKRLSLDRSSERSSCSGGSDDRRPAGRLGREADRDISSESSEGSGEHEAGADVDAQDERLLDESTASPLGAEHEESSDEPRKRYATDETSPTDDEAPSQHLDESTDVGTPALGSNDHDRRSSGASRARGTSAPEERDTSASERASPGVPAPSSIEPVENCTEATGSADSENQDVESAISNMQHVDETSPEQIDEVRLPAPDDGGESSDDASGLDAVSWAERLDETSTRPIGDGDEVSQTSSRHSNVSTPLGSKTGAPESQILDPVRSGGASMASSSVSALERSEGGVLAPSGRRSGAVTDSNDGALDISDTSAVAERLRALYLEWMRMFETLGRSPSMEQSQFARRVRSRLDQVRAEYGVSRVEMDVELEGDRVNLVVRPAS
jgi:hypothetical protein